MSNIDVYQLKANEILTLTLASGNTATWYTQASTTAAASAVTSLSSGSTTRIGPYNTPTNIVITGSPSDSGNTYSVAAAGASDTAVQVLAANGAVLPNAGLCKITKGSAIAATLAAPTAAQEGMLLTITAQTGYAHVITATSLYNNGASGSPYTTATFAAYVGASITLRAINSLWNVVASTACTLS